MTNQNERSGEESSGSDERGSAVGRRSGAGVLGRRGYLKAVGATAALVGGVGASAGAIPMDSSGTPDSPAWQLQFEDDFDGRSLDEDNWALGWGWGLGAPGSKVSWARDRHVDVSDSMLRLTASKEDYDSTGELYVGAIHSKNRVTVEPPVYFEARCQFIQGVGWQNAFWSKPNTEAWPPEIDVVEYLQPRASRADESSHNLHYSASGEPGDSSTHRTVNGSYSGYDSEAEWPGNRFHVYGVEWRRDVIRHYVDGQVVEETTDPDVIEAFNRGGPEYLMLSLNLDNVGTTDKSGSWDDREFLCDWVRVWDYDSDADTADTGDSGTTQDHYLWLRSENGEAASFEFTVDGGNLTLDSSGYEADYRISDDGQTAGGTVASQSQLPGFRFDGEITDLTYDGPLQMYLDDQEVEPDSYVTAAEEHYLWARSGTGDSVTFAFEAGAGDVRLEPSDSEADYWVADDGLTGGGTTSRRSSLPGFRFAGDVTDLSYEGPLELYIDNQPVDPDTLVDRSSPGPYEPTGYPNTITFRSADDGSNPSYSFAVSGSAVEASELEPDDELAGSTAAGTVDGSPDEYAFNGELTALALDGDAAVLVNGERLDRFSLTRADGSRGTVNYIVETTGGVQSLSPSTLDGNDDTSESKIQGKLRDGTDYFWLSASEVVDVSTFGGDVVTRLNGAVIERSD